MLALLAKKKERGAVCNCNKGWVSNQQPAKGVPVPKLDKCAKAVPTEQERKARSQTTKTEINKLD